jgi:hypothetical protein
MAPVSLLDQEPLLHPVRFTTGASPSYRYQVQGAPPGPRACPGLVTSFTEGREVLVHDVGTTCTFRSRTPGPDVGADHVAGHASGYPSTAGEDGMLAVCAVGSFSLLPPVP